mgnify:CR=1 FL=1
MKRLLLIVGLALASGCASAPPIVNATNAEHVTVIAQLARDGHAVSGIANATAGGGAGRQLISRVQSSPYTSVCGAASISTVTPAGLP